LATGFISPPNSDYAGYHQYIDDYLPDETPYLYGLHPNAEIGYLTTVSQRLFKVNLFLSGAFLILTYKYTITKSIWRSGPNTSLCKRSWVRSSHSTIIYVQSTAHQTVQFRLCTALISIESALISNCRCIAGRAVDRTCLFVLGLGVCSMYLQIKV
jgi:hypothetical protein